MKIVINPKYTYLNEFINDLHFRFEQEGSVIYDKRNKLKTYFIQDTPIVVKRFKTPIWINRFAYSFIRKSKARRSFEHALKLVQLGDLTPEPIAYIEREEKGLIKESYYICIYDQYSVEIRDYMNGSMYDETILKGIAEFISLLHRSNIYHLDLSPGNILVEKKVDGTHKFSLIDINRLEFQKLSIDSRYKNFNRLCCSYDVSSELARIYAEINHLNIIYSIKMVNYYSDQFFMKKAFFNSFRKTTKEYNWAITLSGPLWFYFKIKFTNPTFFSNSEREKLKEIYQKYIQEEDIRKVLLRFINTTRNCSNT